MSRTYANDEGKRATASASGGALASLSLSVLLASLATSAVNVTLPTLAAELDASFGQVQWVVLAYLLAVTTLVVTTGRLGDLVGRRRLLVAGLAVFTAASVLCGVAPGLPALIGARAAQGVGAAVMMGLAMALVGEAVPRARTGSAMGLLGAMSAVGTSLGPSLGGLLIAEVGWRAVFLVNAPLGAATLLLARRHLPEDRRRWCAGAGASGPRGSDGASLTGRHVGRAPAEDAPHRRPATDAAAFDLPGALVLGLTLAAFALAVTSGDGRWSARHAGLLGAAGVGLALFALVEARAPSPLLPLSLLRRRARWGGLAASAVVSAVMMTTLVVGPFHLSRGLGLEAAGVGLVMSVGPLVAAAAGVPAGRLVDRVGARRAGLVGLLGLAAGTSALATIPAALGVAGYVTPIVLTTCSYALFQAANNTAVMADAPSDVRGVVAGALNLSRNLGLLTGASVMASVFARASGALDVAAAAPDAVAGGMRTTFAVATVMVVGVAVLVVTDGERLRRAHPTDGAGEARPGLELPAR